MTMDTHLKEVAMAMNRIQFQRGLSLSEFLHTYGTEPQCEAALEKARWPQGFTCPDCHSSSHCVVWHGRVKTFQCNRCRRQVTLTAGTIFHSSKLALSVWFQAIYFLTQGKNSTSTLELMRLLGVSYRTAWRIKHKLMQTMCEREESTVLAQRVEIDDAYLGGERTGGKVGRGSENKVPFIAAVETNEEGHPLRVLFSPVKSFSRDEVETWAKRSLTPTATVISDGLACFRGVTGAGCTHKPEVVGAGRKSTEMGCFHWINTILGNLKTSIDGTYHGFKFEKYAYRYLAEVQYRFNRRFDLRNILPRLVYAAAAIGKRPEAWLRATG
jgi:transposase-like protein